MNLTTPNGTIDLNNLPAHAPRFMASNANGARILWALIDNGAVTPDATLEEDNGDGTVTVQYLVGKRILAVGTTWCMVHKETSTIAANRWFSVLESLEAQRRG